MVEKEDQDEGAGVEWVGSVRVYRMRMNWSFLCCGRDVRGILFRFGGGDLLVCFESTFQHEAGVNGGGRERSLIDLEKGTVSGHVHECDTLRSPWQIHTTGHDKI